MAIMVGVLIYVLDLVGVFAFAAYGAYKALQVRMDLFGVFVCAALTAIGGGTVREMILRGQPAYLHDYRYAGVILIAVIFTVSVYHHFHKINRYMLILDAIGLTTFAFIGADRAAHAGLGLGGMMLCAILTAVGGGILSDLMTGRPPQLFYGDFYAAPAAAMAVLHKLFQSHLQDPVVTYSMLVCVLLLRILALYLRWGIWRPISSKRHQLSRHAEAAR